MLEKEKHFIHIVYKRLRKTYKFLLPLIEAEGNSINETLPASPHWSYSLLRVGRKGCRDLRKLINDKKDIDYSKWEHMINGSRFLDQLQTVFLPNEAGKAIASGHGASTVPLARDMQISILRNNMYTRKILYNMQVIADPFCVFCPGIEDCRIHRLWSCPKSQRIWSFVNKVLEGTSDSPIFIKEAILGEYDEHPDSHRNITILYAKWFIDQAKREEKAPNLIHFAAALSNVLGAQFEFLQLKLDAKAKTKIQRHISSYYFFLSKLDELRQEESSYETDSY